MAEVAGVVASGAGFLSLSIQLLESARKLERLYHQIKNAPQTLRALRDRLEVASFMISELDKYRQRDNVDGALLARCVDECELYTKQITDLVQKLEGKVRKYSTLGNVLVALRHSEIASTLTDLDGSITRITLAFEMFKQSVT